MGVNVDQPPLESSNQVPGPPFPADTVLEPEHDLMDSDQEGDQVCLTGSSTVVQKADSHEYLQTVTAAKFLLQLREGRQISQVAISDVTTNCSSCWNALCNSASNSVLESKPASVIWEYLPTHPSIPRVNASIATSIKFRLDLDVIGTGANWVKFSNLSRVVAQDDLSYDS